MSRQQHTSKAATKKLEKKQSEAEIEAEPPLSPAADALSEAKVMRIVVPAIVGVVAVLAVSSAIGAYFYCKWKGGAPSKAGARTAA